MLSTPPKVQLKVPSTPPKPKFTVSDKIIIDRTILEENIVMKCDRCNKILHERKWKLKGIFQIITNIRKRTFFNDDINL
jgi:hypothetical protein